MLKKTAAEQVNVNTHSHHSLPKTCIAVLCGGQSAEHEISLRSAANIIAALNKEKYEVYAIRIERSGEWVLLDNHYDLAGSAGRVVTLELGARKALLTLDGQLEVVPVDIVFPVLHGPNGEDGTVQGVLELANVPFVGAGVLGSAICMDKVVSKQLLQNAGIPQSQWLVVERHHSAEVDYRHIVAELGLPLFVKPANIGSSVGISKVHNQTEIQDAIDLALQYDHKVIIEECICGRDVECSVLGNEHPRASLPGEVVSHREFYDYEAKYDPEGATLNIPADLPETVTKQIQQMAIKAFKTLCCHGLARADFFVTAENKVYLNELNTLPGFTNTSMYPKLWMATGMTYVELIDQLIELAFMKFEKDRALSSTFTLHLTAKEN